MDSMYSFYIKEVVDQLNDLLLKLNHEKGMDEGRQRLLEMATSIEQFPQDIVSSQRIATEKTTIQVEQDGNIGDFRISKGKTKLNLYLLTDLIIISKLKQRGLVNKTNKEIYMTTIMHDSIRGLYRVSFIEFTSISVTEFGGHGHELGHEFLSVSEFEFAWLFDAIDFFGAN